MTAYKAFDLFPLQIQTTMGHPDYESTNDPTHPIFQDFKRASNLFKFADQIKKLALADYKDEPKPIDFRFSYMHTRSDRAETTLSLFRKGKKIFGIRLDRRSIQDPIWKPKDREKIKAAMGRFPKTISSFVDHVEAHVEKEHPPADWNISLYDD